MTAKKEEFLGSQLARNVYPVEGNTSGFGPVLWEFILSEQHVTKDENNKTLGHKLEFLLLYFIWC